MMNSDIFECSHDPSCKWEKKYRLKEKEYKKLEAKLEQQSNFYYEKLNFENKQKYELENLVQLKRKKNQKKKQKINTLKQIIRKKDEEIKELESHVEFNKSKIQRLVKSRHQSVDQINELEAQVENSKRLLLTPAAVRTKKERRSMQSTLEFNLGIVPFEISEAAESKQQEQERLIGSQSKLLQEEKIKNRELLYKIEMLNNDMLSMQHSVDSLRTLLSNVQTQTEKEKENLKKVLTDKINSLKFENLDLKQKLKDFCDGDSAANTSDIDFCNLKDELSKLEISNRSKLFDLNNSVCESESRVNMQVSFQQLELQKIIQMLEHNLNSATTENQKLKEEVNNKKRHARELNRILNETISAFENFRQRFSKDGAQEEVRRLNLEKVKIGRMVEIKKMELERINEKIGERRGVGRKTHLEEVSERSNEESLRNNMAALIGKQRQFPEDYRRRRNIASWSYNFFNHDFSICKEDFD